MKALSLAILVLLLPGLALAGMNYGVRGGLTFSPDQVHVGGHVDLGPVADRVSLRPNVEVGFGDNLLILAMNFEGVYRFQDKWQAWSPYAGAGVGINRLDFDDDMLQGSSITETGLLLVAGIERGRSDGGRLFLESKVGFSNAPDLKFTVGWTFAK